MVNERDEKTFMRSIIGDAAAAIHRANRTGSDESRRSAIRTISAAIEGLVWEYRSAVIWAATELDVMDDGDRLATAETTHSISAQGRVNSQPRFIPTLSLLRFLAKLAERVTPDAAIAFDDNQWNTLNDAIKLRNRITHPKKASDVLVDASDIDNAFGAFNWLCEHVILSMDAVIGTMRDHADEMWHVLTKLREEDPYYTAEYRRIQAFRD